MKKESGMHFHTTYRPHIIGAPIYIIAWCQGIINRCYILKFMEGSVTLLRLWYNLTQEEKLIIDWGP